MCVVSPKFRGFRMLSAYVHVTCMSQLDPGAIHACWGRGRANTLVYSIDSIESHASVASVDFDQAASYTLERLKTPEVKLKPD